MKFINALLVKLVDTKDLKAEGLTFKHLIKIDFKFIF